MLSISDDDCGNLWTLANFRVVLSPCESLLTTSKKKFPKLSWEGVRRRVSDTFQKVCNGRTMWFQFKAPCAFFVLYTACFNSSDGKIWQWRRRYKCWRQYTQTSAIVNQVPVARLRLDVVHTVEPCQARMQCSTSIVGIQMFMCICHF